MDVPIILWMDLRKRRSQAVLDIPLPDHFRVCRMTALEEISTAITQNCPQIACFDFDYPDIKGLSILRQTKLHYPSLPILMFAENSSETLAIWAFRTGVRDYFIKPVKLDELHRSIAALSKLSRPYRKLSRSNLLAPYPIPAKLRFSMPARNQRSTLPALSYVDVHLHDKISLEIVACMCGMGSFQFSRAFKHQQGLTFREFLIQRRIAAARKLLKNSTASVTDIAFTVGFSGPSHLARMFRRYEGASPSEFRSGNQLR